MHFTVHTIGLYYDICEALAMSYQEVKTASRYDVRFWRYLDFGSEQIASTASKVRADSEHVLVFTSELGSHTIGLARDQSCASFE